MTYLRKPAIVKDFRKQTNVSCPPLHVKPTEIWWMIYSQTMSGSVLSCEVAHFSCAINSLIVANRLTQLIYHILI